MSTLQRHEPASAHPSGAGATSAQGSHDVTQQAGAAPSKVIALDGPSGSGKSTVARGVARALGWRYLDTGATYRAATLAVLRAGVDPADLPVGEPAVIAAVQQARIELATDPDAPGIVLDGSDVSAAIRGPEVTASVSAVSAVPAVRAMLVALQQEVLGAGRAVVEGRDICAVVAPAALVKVYLDADPLVRAARRAGDTDAGVLLPGAHASSGPGGPASEGIAVATVAADLARRDALDSSRAESPLEAAPDAVHLDASHLTAEQVVAAVLALAERAGLIE